MSSDKAPVADKSQSEEAPAPPSGDKSRKRSFPKKRSGKGSTQRRQDEYRTKENDRFLNDPNASRGRSAMDKKWSGQGLEFDIPIDPTPITRNTTWLPLSLRGVGAAVAVSYSKLLSLQPQKVAQLCSVTQAFRACLAQVTLRLSNQMLRRPSTSLTVPRTAELFLEPHLSSVVEACPRTFSMIASLISGIGWFEHDQTIFQTYVEDAFEDDELTEYAAFRVHSLNLRLIVERLAGQDEEEARLLFDQRNCIPGAMYQDHRLLDPNAICPVGYPTPAQMRSDFEALSSLLEFARVREPSLVGVCVYQDNTSPIALVSREIEAPGRLTVYQDDARFRYQFDIDYGVRWTSLRPLPDQYFYRGVLSLLGEYEDDPTPARHPMVAQTSRIMDWNGIAEMIRNRGRTQPSTSSGNR